MSGGAKKSLTVEVFPFLAVLVCTMGSLIFLLLITARQVRVRAVAYAAHQEALREIAAVEAAALATALPSFPEPEEKPAAPVIVLPPQPKREPKPIKLPDQTRAFALAERERELSDLKAKWRLKVNQLSSERDRQKALLSKHKKMVDGVLEQANSLKSEVGTLETQLEKLSDDSTLQPTDDAERLSVQRQITEMKRRLRAAKVAAATAENDKFQVVPFDPQTGTTRRPILIECTGNGIRFLPEDIMITAEDLNGFTPRTNPLAAGTGALINYWTAWNAKQSNPRAEPEPYVLILVRPDGVVAYYVAMRMLENIRTAHGYELIDESTSLQLPELDQGAQSACLTAVRRLLGERENVYRHAVASGSGSSVFGGPPRRGGSGGGPGGGSGGGAGAGLGGGSAGGSGLGPGGGMGRRPGGGPEGIPSGGYGGGSGSGTGNRSGTGTKMFGPGEDGVAGSGPGGNGVPGGTDGEASGAGRPGGGNVFTMSDITGGDSSVGTRSWERVENFEGRPRRRGSDGGATAQDGSSGAGGSGTSGDLPNGTRAGSGTRTGKRNGTGSAVGSATGTGSGGGVAAGTGKEGNPDSDTEAAGTGTAGGESTARSSSAAGTRTSSGDDDDSTTASNSQRGTSASGDDSGDAQGSTSGGSGGSQRRSRGPQGRWSSNPANSTGGATGDSSGGDSEPEPGMPIGQRPGKKGAQPKSGADVAADEQGDDADGDASGGSGSRSGSRASNQSSRLSLSDNDSSAPRYSNGSRSGRSDARPKSTDKDAKQLEPEMLAGRRWGYAEPGASIGFEREVRVNVSANLIVIAEKYEIPIEQGEGRQETFESFVTSLDRHSHEWGRPPQGFFWTPRLQFVVKPDGDAQYEQLNSMMKRAGLATSHEFFKDSEIRKYGRDPRLAKPTTTKTASSINTGGTR